MVLAGFVGVGGLSGSRCGNARAVEKAGQRGCRARAVTRVRVGAEDGGAEMRAEGEAKAKAMAEEAEDEARMSPEHRRAWREEKARERELRIKKKREEKQARLDAIESANRAAPTMKEMRAGLRKESGDMSAAEQQELLESSDGTYGANATGLFGWVNNNPSSKNAVYIGSFQGEGGNVGEMMKAIRGRGRTEEGMDIDVSQPAGSSSEATIRTYVRKVPSENSTGASKSPILFVHGVLASSWTFRDVLKPLSAAGHDCYAFDWPGSGYSEWPQPGIGFSFSEKRFVSHLENLLVALNLAKVGTDGILEPVSDSKPKVTLAVQGFVMPQYVLKWALQSDGGARAVDAVVVMNTPVAPGHKLPFVLQQYKLPLVNSFVAQDAMRSERFLEGGGPYVMTLSDAERFREPFLESMMPGLAVTDTLVKCKFDQLIADVDRLLESRSPADAPAVRVLWGVSDKYLPAAAAREWCEKRSVPYTAIEGAGFVVQSDWPEKVVDAMRSILL